MAIGTTAAILGAAAIGAGGTVAAASSNKKAINKSTDASLAAQREAIAAQEKAAELNRALISQNMTQAQGFQREAYNNAGQTLTNTYNQGISALNPYAQTGYSALNQRNALLGLPDQGSYTIQQAKFTPIAAPVTPTPQPATAATAVPKPTGTTNALLANPLTQSALAQSGANWRY